MQSRNLRVVLLGLYDYGNSTSNQCGAGASSQKVHIGFIAAAIAVIFFGSQYLPVKKFDTGDGKHEWTLFF